MTDPTRDLRRSAPAALRNRQPLLDVLRDVLPCGGEVLEIASGTGEHVVFFAAALPEITWRPSDPDPEARASIAAWTDAEGVRNVGPPLDIDASAPVWPVARADAVLCINMIHIAPWATAEGLMAGASHLLASGAPLVLYGPFRREGRHTAPSNAEFDRALRARNPAWGVRDLEAVRDLAADHGMRLDRWVEMPANNLTLIFHRI